MLDVRFLILSTALLGSTWAVRHLPSSFFNGRWNTSPPPIHRDEANVTRAWMDQKLDHYNPTSITTWKQQYLYKTIYYKDGGPVFLYIGGESPIDTFWEGGGFMQDLAKKYGALVFALEHRFYGKSRPTKDMSTENLRYLTKEQALVDTAYFIEHMNDIFQLNGAKWIVFGGSYPGTLAAWMRLKFPHLVHGAVSSSAPVLAQANFTSYYEIVGTVLNNTNSQCYADLKNATEELTELERTQEGLNKAAEIFNLCNTLDINDKDNLYLFHFMWVSIVSGAVKNGGDEPRELCEKLTNKKNGATPLERYAKLMDGTCLSIDFTGYVDMLADDSWDSFAAIVRAWVYQCCSDFGYFQTTDSPNQPLRVQLPLDYFMHECSAIFGEQYNEDLLNYGVERSNIFYGGKHPEVTNVVFVNGGGDPWQGLGVLEDLSPDATAVIIEGLSHCEDMKKESSSDPPQVKTGHEKISAIVKGWLDQ